MRLPPKCPVIATSASAMTPVTTLTLLYSSGRRDSHQTITVNTATLVPKKRCATAESPLNFPSARCM